MQLTSGLKSVPAKLPRVAVYLSEEIKADLVKLAMKERRSESSMAAILIEEGINKAKADGRLTEEQSG